MPGEAKPFAVLGQNLSAPEGNPRTTPLASRRWPGAGSPSSRETLITSLAPADSRPLPSGVALTRGGWFTAIDLPFPSNGAFLAESREPIVNEKEPNSTIPQAQSLHTPCEVIAAFQGPRDVDRYRFHASAGSRLVVEVVADRMGMPVDPEFVIRRLAADGTATDLATGDDQADPFEGRRFPIGTLDPRAVLNVPADGDYEVAVRDSNGSARTDSPLAYRLLIRPERPDFDLILVPNDAASPEGATVRAGGRSSAYVLANRIDGLTAPFASRRRSCRPASRANRS